MKAISATTLSINPPSVITVPPPALFNLPKTDFKGLNTFFHQFDWIKSLDGLGVEEMLTVIVDTINHGISLFSPPHSNSTKTILLKHIQNLINYRGKVALTNDYEHLCKVSKVTAKKLARCNANVQNRLVHKPKDFYNYIKNRTKRKAPICTIESNGTVLTDNKDKAEALGDYYSTVWETPSNITSQVGSISNAPTSKLSFYTIEPTHVAQALQKVKPSLHPTSDGISGIILKKCANSLALPLSILFNHCLIYEQLPQCFGHSTIIPFPKQPSATLPKEHRPISITSNFCRTLPPWI
uniref:Reverse transcriptase domain-containing protein n=1 Tax=Panagrellus redivivus TaxID=6233 RepID=A0A7E4ZW63_PANRE